MAASYPSNVKSFSTKIDFTDIVFAEHINSLQEEVAAVQTAIGTLPTASSGWSGAFDTTSPSWANLKSRINNIEYGLKNAYDKVGGSNILGVANGGTGISSLGIGIATFLGTPSSANLIAAITDETGSGSLVFGTSPTITPAAGTTTTATTGAGYMGMPQNSQSVGYTLVAADAGKHVYVTTNGTTLTIPANSSLAFPIGTTVVVVNGSGVSTTISCSDTLRLANSASTGNRTLASNGMCTLLKINTTEWIASGNGLT